MKAFFINITLALLLMFVLANGVLSAPSLNHNEKDPWTGIVLSSGTPSPDKASLQLVHKAKMILNSPRNNIRIPPSQRVFEINELEALRNGTLKRRTDVAGQTAADTRSKIRSFGSVNTQADVVSAISLAKINALFAEKYADKKDDSRKFTNYTSDPYTPWGSTASYWAKLVVGPPLFAFIDNDLHMTVELEKGSAIIAKFANGTEVAKDIVSKTPVITSAPLTRVKGTSKDFSVVLNINETQWIVHLNIGSETVDPSFEAYVQKGLQSYFTATFHDSDYILGTVILNPEAPGIIKGLNPKEFIMRTVEDAYGRSGNGFLVLMIQTDGASLTDTTPKQLPTKFNLVPDGYDTALYITNRALYNSIYLDSFAPIASGLTPAEVDGTLNYKSGGVHVGNLNQPDYCPPIDDVCLDIKSVDHYVRTSTFTTTHSDDAHPQRLSIHGALSQTFRGCRTTVLGNPPKASCFSFTAVGDFSINLSFDFSLTEELIDIKYVTSDYKMDGDFSSKWWETWFVGTKDFIKKKANEWGETSAGLIKNNPPKIQSLNTFRLNRILFPINNIYSYKEVYSLADLVLFGNTVSK
eukprot:Nk52_evm1s2485 gene=Nk52_evmTU1s2485